MTENIIFKDIHAAITPDEINNIPEEMKREARWICWGSDKIPVCAAAGKEGFHFGVDVTKWSSWGTFEQAVQAIGEPARVRYGDDYEYFHISGIGFVVGDGWFCADLDGGAGHGREDVPANVAEFAISNMNSYAEISVSGCGYHIFGKCGFDTREAENNEPHRDKNGDVVPGSYEVEFFTRRKFIAITGRIHDKANRHITDCKEYARQFYEEFILRDQQREREKEAARRAERIREKGPASPDSMEEFFMQNYPEILAASDSSNFRRGGQGAKLGPGQYSWIGALKAMQEIGVPESYILDWCRRGSNFKSERDVLRVLSKESKGQGCTVAGLIADARAHGWQPDPEKLTGEYKKNHDAKAYREKELKRWQDEHREEHIAQLAELGIDCAGDPYKFAWTKDFDGSIDTVTDKETGEIMYQKSDEARAAARAAGDSMRPDPEQPVPGMTVYTARGNEKMPSAPDPAAPWEPIVKGKSLPKFPIEQFPAWVQNHIKNYCATNGADPDFCAAAVLGTLSAVTVGHCDILFNSGHREPIQLYSAFVGDPSSYKTSVIKHFMSPAYTWLRLRNEAAIKANYAIKKEIERLEKDLSAEKKAGAKGNPNRIEELSAEIEEKKKEQAIGFPVPWDDVTPESLLNAMNFTRGTANIATAEGNIINVICGRSYTQRGAVQNLDVFLKGADAESIHSFRVTSGEIDIPRADLSMLIGLQPALLERLCSSADASGRGLTQRFLIYTQSETKNAIDHTIPVRMDPEHAARWANHINTIAARFMDPNSDALTMELEPAADMIIREFWNYESELIAERGSGDNETIISWIGKLHGKALRVSALIALLRDKFAEKITKEDAETAVYLFKAYYLPHFIAANDRRDNLTKEQRYIVNRIIKTAKATGRADIITEHEIWLYVRQIKAFSGIDGRRMFMAALEDLSEMNYIRPAEPIKTASGRGRPAKAWQINPEIFA